MHGQTVQKLYAPKVNFESIIENKHLSQICTFWEQLNHQILGVTVTKATLKSIQNTLNAIFGISFTGVVYFTHLRT